MKKLIYSITAILGITATLGLSSCLKDSRYVDLSNVGTLVELPLAAYTGAGVFTVDALPVQSAPQTIPVVVNVAAPKALGSALKVTLKINTDTLAKLDAPYQQQLAAYNAGTGDAPTATHYQLPPSNAYSISSLTVTVPANQHTASVNISVITSNFDLSAVYLIPVTIVDASGQKISNYNTVIFNVQAKNVYDGQWTVNGTMTEYANTALSGKYPVDYYLETQGANTDALFDYNYSGAFGHEIISGGNTSYFGSFSPLFTFDANGNITAVTNYYGQHSGGHGRSAQLDPSGQNKFISGTPGSNGAKFQVTYDLYQDDFSTTKPAAVFTETYTYDGARP